MNGDLLTLLGHHLVHFGDKLETLWTTPGHHLGQLGRLTTWHHLEAAWTTLENCLGQLGDNLKTTFGQLGDNFETTWGQLGYNCETTSRQLGTTLGPHGDYYLGTITYYYYLFFRQISGLPKHVFFPLGCLNVYKICLRIWFGHLKCRYLYPQNSKTLSKKFWLIEILLISAFTKSWSERDSGAEKSGSGLGGGEQCEHVPVRTGSAARGSEGAAAPNNPKKSRGGARITESARWNTKPPSAANSPSFKAWLFRIHIRPSKIEVLYHLWLLNYQSPH